MAAKAGTLLGSTVAFATTTFTGKITGIDFSGTSRPAVDTSHIGLGVYATGDSAYRTFIPSGLIDGGELKLDLVWTQEKEPPISKAAESITLTLTNLGTAAGVIIFPGFVTGYSITGEQDGCWKGTVTVKVSGAPTTWTAAS